MRFFKKFFCVFQNIEAIVLQADFSDLGHLDGVQPLQFSYLTVDSKSEWNFGIIYCVLSCFNTKNPSAYPFYFSSSKTILWKFRKISGRTAVFWRLGPSEPFVSKWPLWNSLNKQNLVFKTEKSQDDVYKAIFLLVL